MAWMLGTDGLLHWMGGKATTASLWRPRLRVGTIACGLPVTPMKYPLPETRNLNTETRPRCTRCEDYRSDISATVTGLPDSGIMAARHAKAMQR